MAFCSAIEGCFFWENIREGWCEAYFYKSLGFEEEGIAYEEDGIPHQEMVKGDSSWFLLQQ